MKIIDQAKFARDFNEKAPEVIGIHNVKLWVNAKDLPEIYREVYMRVLVNHSATLLDAFIIKLFNDVHSYYIGDESE